ncbi:MAG: transpeptidase family protein [Chitinophagaceae bacterium]|nr:transpeptidase family protein [Chitinophagaceae bacterium]MBK7678894.1 transpeptidase family protein [Chitinophagaceae bacterium]MBK8299761.1 transpeptidase family protein [Chitinophagaceae bacterium]MBK9463810.1 transpeptidase family protein [Chitinophagaceae bacterium]MBK9937403.1 transpeptidase family protein [Chitinophagaceae bacterium]
MDVKRDILWRVYLSFIGIVLISVLVLGRAFYIQRFQGNHWRSMSDSLHQQFLTLDAERGTIYSEDGQMLSTSIPTFDVFIDFNADGLREKKGKRFNENVDSFAISLANYFNDKTATQYKKELQLAFKENARYYPLKKKLSFDEYKSFRDFPLARLGRNKSGIIIQTSSKRLPPFGLLANRTIGLAREFKDGDKKNKKQNVGLERSYDSVLSGKDGQRLVRRIAGGTLIPVEGAETEPVNGKDIYTTIDVNMQDIAETALMRMMLQCEGPYGTAIVMETNTGKIKAMANLGRRPDGSYWEDDNYALRATEPGSTIKLATLLSVLEKGTSKIDDKVEVGGAGRLQVGSKMVTDAERSPRAVLTVKECFAHSSNVGMSKLAYKAFAQRPEELKEYLHRFHLDVRSPIDLSDVPKPTMAPLNQKGSAEGNMLWMSFGYGLQVSPLHTLTLYNAIANNGKMMKPYLVNTIQSNGLITKQLQPIVLEEKLCKPDVVQAARASMEATVIDGTATRVFKGMPFAVAGKTGTAHVSDGPIKYGDGVYQATFVGYFPADKPQFTCIVVVRTKPHAASHYGGTVAAPVFREIATKLYAMYVEKKNPSRYAGTKDSSGYFYAGFTKDIKNVFKAMNMAYRDSVAENNWASVYANNYQPVMKAATVRQQVMPNVRGMGLKDAVYLLENMGLKVAVRGRGKITMQSVAPGTALAKGVTVILELS